METIWMMSDVWRRQKNGSHSRINSNPIEGWTGNSRGWVMELMKTHPFDGFCERVGVLVEDY
jgi:hypothetical protein